MHSDVRAKSVAEIAKTEVKPKPKPKPVSGPLEAYENSTKRSGGGMRVETQFRC